ncbi:MAG: hypothetical protein IE909_14250 [Campylobacterales bacterium]|nr:hypothetical protein [Campylobacterales bacterium]
MAKIVEIADMNENELHDFGVKISLSDVDDKAKLFLYKAIDVRREQLASVIGIDVVNCDLDDMDFSQW